MVADNAQLDFVHDRKVSCYDVPEIIDWMLMKYDCQNVCVCGAVWNWMGAMSLKSYTALKDLGLLGLSDATIKIASVRVVEEGYGIYFFFRSCTLQSTGAKKLTKSLWRGHTHMTHLFTLSYPP